MRILVTSVPASGHLLPLLPLVTAAERAGHEVLVATGANLVDTVSRLGHETRPVGPTWAEAGALPSPLPAPTGEAAAGSPGEAAAGWPGEAAVGWPGEAAALRHRMTAGASGMFGLSAVHRYGDLLALARDWRPDLLVHGLAELSAPVVARRLGLPAASHGYGPHPLSFAAFYRQIVGVTEDGLGVPGLADAIFASAYVDPCPPSLHARVLPYSRIVSVRPEPAESPSDLPWPAGVGSRPTAYLTLGTVVNQTPGVLATALAGLRRLPLDVVVTTGPGVDPGVLGPQPDHVHVTDYLPQEAVLPRCALVVSHAGAGTILGALGHARPMVSIPIFAEQPWNAIAVARAGAARTVKPAGLTEEVVADAARRVLDDPAYAARAGELQSELQAMPAPADALRAVLAQTVSVPGSASALS